MKHTIKIAQLVDPNFKQALLKLLSIQFKTASAAAMLSDLCQQADTHINDYHEKLNELARKFGKPVRVIKPKYHKLVNAQLQKLTKRAPKDLQAQIDRLLGKYGEPSPDRFEIPTHNKPEFDRSANLLLKGEVTFEFPARIVIPKNSAGLTGLDIYVLNGLAEVEK